MHGAPFRVLVLEDNPDDYQLLLDILGDRLASGLHISHCQRLGQALGLLEGGGFDVVLSDLGLPDSQGLETITRLVERFPTLPLVVLTGLDDENMGLEAVREGAQDYLVKGSMDPELLLRTLRYAIERKKTQEYLRQARDELELRVQERTAELTRANLQLVQAQKLEAIGTLAGGIAHDFNNILTAIIGYTELALASGHLLDEDRQYLEQVLAAGERARDMVSQILAFSRQGASEHKIIQIAPVVKEALKLLRASIPTTIELRQYIARDAGKVLGDPTHIHQVLMNLCTNASHAMRQTGGVLGVTLETLALDAREAAAVGNLKPGAYLCLTVSDTGHGMPPEVQQRIFEPFFTTKNVDEGTGLGLSVVHGIVKNHGGAITVQSQPGQGSTFKVYLPSVEAVAEQPAQQVAPLPRGTGNVMFVDDEEPLADLGRIMLERLGYTAHIFTSSLEALAAFRFQPQDFDLVVSDNIMPHMTGLQLAAEIKAIRPDLPVALCTGNSEHISPESRQALGVARLISKPLSYREMAEHLRDLLGQAGQQAATGGEPLLHPEERPSQAGDVSQTVGLLWELSLSLDTDMAEALERLDHLGGLLSESPQAPDFRRVDEMVRQFDLEAARQAIGELIQGLQGRTADGPEAGA